MTFDFLDEETVIEFSKVQVGEAFRHLGMEEIYIKIENEGNSSLQIPCLKLKHTEGYDKVCLYKKVHIQVSK